MKILLLLGGIGLAGVALYSFYKWYIEGAYFWDTLPGGRYLENLYVSAKERLFGKTMQTSMRDERDFPDEDDEKVGFNVHTTYGSI
jgi:hypothetical protein